MDLTIATCSVRNPFDNYTQDGSSRPKPDDEIEALATMLERIDADVVALQEVESRAALDKVNTALGNRHPHVGFQRGNSQRGIHLAYLSRHRLPLRSH